jgi:hypothetical protein
MVTVERFSTEWRGVIRFSLTPARFLPIPVLKVSWIDWGPRDDLFFAAPAERRSRKERGPPGNRTDSQLGFRPGNWRVRTAIPKNIVAKAAQDGNSPRSSRRRPKVQKSSSPTVGGGSGHEILSHPVLLSPFQFFVCCRGRFQTHPSRRAPQATARLRLGGVRSGGIGHSGRFLCRG